MKKTVNTVTTIYHYSLRGQLIAESDIGGTITAEYVYLNNQPLAKIEGVNVYYYHNDHLGTPQKMTDAAGQVVWEGEFKPFGEAISITGSITNNLRFPGQYYDAETGLHYNYFRDYNPSIGRYVEADPIGIEQGRNHLYVYAIDNPIRFVDPDGLKAVSASQDCTNTSSKCDEYSDCYEYSGANAKCFCKCAGNDPWSQIVRCCLRKKYDEGYSGNAAHAYCYAKATALGAITPVGKLAYCYAKCRKYQKENCPDCKK